MFAKIPRPAARQPLSRPDPTRRPAPRRHEKRRLVGAEAEIVPETMVSGTVLVAVNATWVTIAPYELARFCPVVVLFVYATVTACAAFTNATVSVTVPGSVA